MKRNGGVRLSAVSVLLCFVCTICVSACGRKREAEYGIAAADIVASLASLERPEGSRSVNFGDELFDSYVNANYGLDPETLRDGCLLFCDGANAFEMAVLLTDGEKGAAEDALAQYVSDRRDVFSGYSPNAVRLLDKAVITSAGDWAALFVAEDPGAVEERFLEIVYGEAEPLPPASAGDAGAGEKTPAPGGASAAPSPSGGQEYSRDAVLAAYFSGGSDGLSPINRSVLEAAEEAIAESVTGGMTDYEKELAIHDWIIEWADYDLEAISQSPDAKPGPENDNPYGLLVDRASICSGYTGSFQLFMDMLGIECISVSGTSAGSGEDHAWNMVRLDGEWYCVDLTWDDPIGARPEDAGMRHRYFNRTSEFFADTGHSWDRELTPEATAAEYAWQGQ